MATLEYLVRAVDDASSTFSRIGLSADKLDRQLKDLDKRIANPTVDLNDKTAVAGLADMALKLDRLNKKVSKPEVQLDPVAMIRAEKDILRLNEQLDKLDHKDVTATVKVNVDRSMLSRLGGAVGGRFDPSGSGGLLGKLFGATGGAAGGGGGGGGPWGMILGGLAAALLGPAVLPLGLGALVGGGAAGGALLMGSKAQAQLLKLQTSLKSAKGANRRDILQQITDLKQTQGPVLAVSDAGQRIFGTAMETFNTALGSTGRGFSGAGPNQSFLTSLIGILKQVAGFIKSIGPQLGDMFRASVPYLQVFVHFMEQLAKTLFPVFTKMLIQFTPFLPLMAKGLMQIVQGLAGFLKAIGPAGMQTSAKLFVMVTKLMMWALEGLGWYINRVLVRLPKYAHAVADAFDKVRHTLADWGHNVATWFDRFRHDIAHYWDMTFENTIGVLIRFGHNVEATFNTVRHTVATVFDAVRHAFATVGHAIADVFDTVRHAQGQFGAFEKDIAAITHAITAAFDWMRHGVITILGNMRHGVAALFDGMRHDAASIFDAMRHGIASAWDTIWSNTKTKVSQGIAAVVGFFKRLPGNIIHALWGLGHSLYAFGRSALNEFLSGFKAIGSSIVSWAKNFFGGLVHSIGKFLGMSPPHPGSAFWELGANMMRHLEGGIKSRAESVRAATGSMVKFKAGAGVQQWAGLVRQALAMEGLSPMLAGRVLYQMSTESGGNPNAINRTDINAQRGDPSRGLMQVIGSTFAAYHWPGTSWNIYNPLANIAAALNYARHRYGPTLMSSGMGIGSGHGYASGGIITEPIFGVGMSGRSYTFGERGPETVIPGTARRGGGPLVTFGNVYVQDATDAELIRQKVSYAITSAGFGS